jgi:hypothetical protein
VMRFTADDHNVAAKMMAELELHHGVSI